MCEVLEDAGTSSVGLRTSTDHLRLRRENDSCVQPKRRRIQGQRVGEEGSHRGAVKILNGERATVPSDEFVNLLYGVEPTEGQEFFL